MSEEANTGRIEDPELAHEAANVAKSSIDSSVQYAQAADEAAQHPEAHLNPEGAVARAKELSEFYNDQAERISGAVQRSEKVGEEVPQLNPATPRQEGDHESPFLKTIK